MIAAALLAAAAGPAVVFAPPLDRPMLVRTEQERDLAGTVRRFVAERRLVFRRAPGGLAAELTLLALSTDAEAPVARRFMDGAAGLRGIAVRFRLSPAGAILGIEDEAAVWRAAIAPVLRSAPAAPLADLPPERRRAILAAPLVEAIAAGETVAAGAAAVRVTLGPDALTGRRTAETRGGRLVLVTRARDPAGAVTLERTRTVDPVTGLLVSEEEVTRRRGDGAEQVTRSTVRVTPG